MVDLIDFDSRNKMQQNMIGERLSDLSFKLAKSKPNANLLKVNLFLQNLTQLSQVTRIFKISVLEILQLQIKFQTLVLS